MDTEKRRMENIMRKNKKPYGMELIIDLHDCDVSTFTKEKISTYFVSICKLIKMKRHGTSKFWRDYSKRPHIRGISAMQFIETSDIVVHALDMLKAVYINLFSCKQFNAGIAKKFTKDFFGAKKISAIVVKRF